jgi:hypothetical protein
MRLPGFLNWARRDPPPAEDKTPPVKSRPIMDRILRETLVAELRTRGFSGSLPHLRRIRPDRTDLLTIQYARAGGKFSVELAQCGPGGHKTDLGEEIPPNKVTAHDLFVTDRFHLSRKAGWRGKWFVFDRRSYDPPLATDEATIEANCRKAASAAQEAFNRQAEAWWAKKAERLMQN